MVVTLLGATVEKVTMSEEFLKATEKVAIVCNKLAVSDDQIAAVERVTRGQWKSSGRAAFRQGRITASNFGPVPKACAA